MPAPQTWTAQKKIKTMQHQQKKKPKSTKTTKQNERQKDLSTATQKRQIEEKDQGINTCSDEQKWLTEERKKSNGHTHAPCSHKSTKNKN